MANDRLLCLSILLSGLLALSSCTNTIETELPSAGSKSPAAAPSAEPSATPIESDESVVPTSAGRPLAFLGSGKSANYDACGSRTCTTRSNCDPGCGSCTNGACVK